MEENNRLKEIVSTATTIPCLLRKEKIMILPEYDDK